MDIYSDLHIKPNSKIYVNSKALTADTYPALQFGNGTYSSKEFNLKLNSSGNLTLNVASSAASETTSVTVSSSGVVKFGSRPNVNGTNIALLTDITSALEDYTTTTELTALLENKANKATTLAGYFISDAYTSSYIDSTFVSLKADQTIEGTKIFADPVQITTLSVDSIEIDNLEITESTTFGGTAAFANVPTVTGTGNLATENFVTTKLASKANDSAVVHIAGAETITGVKTFSATPIITNRALKSAASGYTWTFPQKTGTVALTTDLSSYVPTSRTVNGKALSSNITLSAGDVGAYTKSESDAKYVTLSGNETITGTKTFSNAVITNLTTTTLDIQNLNISGATAFTTAPTVNGSSVVTTDGLSTILTGYQPKLTFDTTPKSNSTNPVTSKGIYSYLNTNYLTTASFNTAIASYSKTSVADGRYLMLGSTTAKTVTTPTTFSGTLNVPTISSATDSSTKAASTAFVQNVVTTKISALGTVLNYKGVATTISSDFKTITTSSGTVSASGNTGDVYIIAGTGTNAGVEYVSDGTIWQKIGYNTDLSGYQAKLTFDSTPTSGSSNPVTSSGIYTALSNYVDKNSAQTISGAKTFTGDVTFANLKAGSLSISDLVINGDLTLTSVPTVNGTKLALSTQIPTVPKFEVHNIPALSAGTNTKTITLTNKFTKKPILQLMSSDGEVKIATLKYTSGSSSDTVTCTINATAATSAGAYTLQVFGY